MKTRVKQTGEVFTPRSLIREMLEKLPNSVWFDPNKTWLEPSAGDGNFLVEIKARLLQAGHDEQHILDHMLFSIELIDDNHWVLQHRLGYLVDGNPNPKFWPNGEHFDIGTIHPIAQDLNNNNPYTTIGLDKDQVLFHRNHICTTGLEYDMTFGRGTELPPVLPLLEERALGDWPSTDTPDIGEKYVVEKMLGRQPQLVHQDEVKLSAPKELKIKKEKQPKLDAERTKNVGGGWCVNPKNYGKGLVVESLFNNQIWVADHDALIDDINKSLRKGGKQDLFERPRAFGSSSGLRGGVNGGLFKLKE